MLLVCDSDKLRVKVFEFYLSHLFAVMLCQRIGRLAEVLAYLCAYICKGEWSIVFKQADALTYTLYAMAVELLP